MRTFSNHVRRIDPKTRPAGKRERLLTIQKHPWGWAIVERVYDGAYFTESTLKTCATEQEAERVLRQMQTEQNGV